METFKKQNQLSGLNLKKAGIIIIERPNNEQIVITVSSAIGSTGLDRLIDYIKYLEATAKSKATQADADKLADKVNASWWENNGSRFIK